MIVGFRLTRRPASGLRPRHRSRGLSADRSSGAAAPQQRWSRQLLAMLGVRLNTGTARLSALPCWWPTMFLAGHIRHQCWRYRRFRLQG
ncbi:MAG: hypothetical protein M5R42_06580 [Rhodocyclaceae bacterium]|nr:hypothetical protein [Rhodocyclaceae bacterium]